MSENKQMINTTVNNIIVHWRQTNHFCSICIRFKQRRIKIIRQITIEV